MVRNINILILGPRLEQLFSCGDKACVAQLIMDGGAELRSWNMAINAVVSQLAPMRCDCYFLLAPVKEVHRFQQKFRKHTVNWFWYSLTTSAMLIFRSECLTKNYCSKDCLLSDQAAHTVSCKFPRSMDNVDQRKVKKDGRARAEKANKSLENYQRRSQAELQQKEHRGPIFHGHRQGKEGENRRVEKRRNAACSVKWTRKGFHVWNLQL